ncbi:MAG: TIR domain-containing protein [Halobacteriovoraceae bacterium]|nr:TIR domain-containing protein [Halobacteriovoraceae bacterium]
MSYHWDHKDIAKALEAALTAEGIIVLRDEGALQQSGEDLNAFMKLINHPNLDGVISIVSDQYLKSPNCMEEISETMKRFDWKKSFIPIVVNGDLYQRGSEIPYVKYWEDNKNKWQAKRDRDLATTATMHLEPFLENIRFTIQADVKNLQANGFKEIITRIKDPTAKIEIKTQENLPALIQDKLDHPHKELTLDQSIALLLACISEGKLQAKKASDKEVILFIGNTGAGKSTTVNYLCGCTFQLKPFKELGIKGLGKAVIVKTPSQGGSKDEVMPIGHTKDSKTFMPQIEKDPDTQNTYMDCPGFLDNRGVEINIANAVNIKNAIQESKTAKVIILINYHSLKAERGRGLTEMLKIAYNLFGNEQNLLNAKDSLLIGITNTAGCDSDLEELREWITEGNPTLQKLAERIFTYDPLNREIEGAWNREEFLGALQNLKPVPNHKKIFSTVLTHEDENKLLHISEALGEKIQKALKQGDYKQASTHYNHLTSLSIIEHHTIERLFQTQRREIETHAHGQINTFNSACHLENFNEAEKLLKLLEFAVGNFQELERIIDPPRLKDYYSACQKKQTAREAEFKKYQDEIRSANKRIEEFIKLIDLQKSQMEKQLSEQEENYKKLLSSLESNYSQKLQNLEITMKELLTEKETRLQKTEEELKIAQDLKDQETNKKLLDERKKLEEEYEQKLKAAEEEKNKILQDKQALIEKQQQAHKQKQQEIATQIQTLEDQRVQQQKLQKGAIPEMAFGKAKWEKYFGDIGAEPPLPPNIDEILNSPCSFWPEKKVRETHLLVLVPQTVNGRPFCLDSLEGLIKSPKTGHKTQYRGYSDYVKKELGSKSAPSHWVLMTRDVIEGSRNKSYDDQKKLVQSHAQKTKTPYEMPMALDAATAILMHYVETGKALYTDDKLGPQWTYTRCQEKVNNNQWPATIGGFAAGGLSVDNADFVDHWFFSGVGCVRKF